MAGPGRGGHLSVAGHGVPQDERHAEGRASDQARAEAPGGAALTGPGGDDRGGDEDRQGQEAEGGGQGDVMHGVYLRW